MLRTWIDWKSTETKPEDGDPVLVLVAARGVFSGQHFEGEGWDINGVPNEVSDSWMVTHWAPEPSDPPTETDTLGVLADLREPEWDDVRRKLIDIDEGGFQEHESIDCDLIEQGFIVLALKEWFSIGAGPVPFAYGPKFKLTESGERLLSAARDIEDEDA